MLMSPAGISRAFYYFPHLPFTIYVLCAVSITWARGLFLVLPFDKGRHDNLRCGNTVSFFLTRNPC